MPTTIQLTAPTPDALLINELMALGRKITKLKVVLLREQILLHLLNKKATQPSIPAILIIM